MFFLIQWNKECIDNISFASKLARKVACVWECFHRPSHLSASKLSCATTRGVLAAKQESIHRCFVKPPEVFSYTPILDIAWFKECIRTTQWACKLESLPSESCLSLLCFFGEFLSCRTKGKVVQYMTWSPPC